MFFCTVSKVLKILLADQVFRFQYSDYYLLSVRILIHIIEFTTYLCGAVMLLFIPLFRSGTLTLLCYLKFLFLLAVQVVQKSIPFFQLLQLI